MKGDKRIAMEMDQEYYPMPAFPTLSTSDLEMSKRFYVEGLGFSHVFSIPGPDGQPIVEHIRFVKYGDVLLERESPDSDCGTASRGRGVRITFSAALAHRTCQEIAERARGYGAQVEGPVERPWNVREVTVSDPDGYLLVFTEPLDTTKPMDEVLEEIAEGIEESGG
jgi:catechol 2,3-dioxygenase-like lactoylglutathione lyase family enzyme